MRVLVTAALGAAILAAATSAVAQQPPTRAIVNLTGQLYRAQNNNHYTVFLVTPEGVIMSDPINRDFARWLKGEIATRFKVPVRYVLYTHHDWDHASGGIVFADTAEFVGQVNMLAEAAVPPGAPPLPMAEQKLDANRNGLVERTEATGATADQFAQIDANRDGMLSGAEVARGPLNDVHLPTTTFTDRHTVTLGGKRVEMISLGVAHTPDGAALYFPDERTVFNADVMQIRRLPGGLAPTVGSWIRGAPHDYRARLHHRRHRARAGGHQAGRARVVAVPRGSRQGRGRWRGGRADPDRDPEVADPGRLQGLRALGYGAGSAHRAGLRHHAGNALEAFGSASGGASAPPGRRL